LPSAWRTKVPVLCIAGRGPLDEAAASMLAQLLHKNGLRARVLKHEVTSRCRAVAKWVLLNLRAARLGEWAACVPSAIRLQRCHTWLA
jgi:hypothetical protein